MNLIGRHLNSDRRRFFALCVPTLIIVLLGSWVVYWLLSSASERLDSSEIGSEQKLVATVLANLQQQLQKDVMPTAYWDEHYDQLEAGLDPQWAKDNLGPYSVLTSKVPMTAVVSRNGELKYFFQDGVPDAKLATADLAKLTALANAAINRVAENKPVPLAGTITLNRTPYLAVSAAVTVNSEDRLEKNFPVKNAVFFMRPLNEVLLRELSIGYGLPGLSVVTDKSSMFELPSLSGGSSGYGLKWHPVQTGSDFLKSASPYLILVGVGVGLLLCALAAGWYAMISAMSRAQQRAATAEDVNKSKSLFFASMSHELRTPLNAIIGFSELVKLDALKLGVPDKYREYVNDIHASGKHLLAIVNDLLNYSKIDANQQSLVLEELHPAEALTASVRMTEVVARARQVRLTHIECSGDFTIRADRQAMTQILLNLLSNAIKFSQPGQEVLAECEINHRAGYCEIRVVDHGRGMSDETLSQLGQPFVQSDDVFTRREQGTGLGLAITFALAKKMGGELVIESHKGKGTTVTLRMPLVGFEKLGAPAHFPEADARVA